MWGERFNIASERIQRQQVMWNEIERAEQMFE